MASKLKDSVSFWALFCKADHGGWLFHRNPNPGYDPYHLGRLENILDGEQIVHSRTRRALEMDMDVVCWNEHHPWYKVTPRRVTLEIRPSYAKRSEGGGDA